jgi:hypothetical protein
MRGAAAAFLNVDTCSGAPGLRYEYMTAMRVFVVSL